MNVSARNNSHEATLINREAFGLQNCTLYLDSVLDQKHALLNGWRFGPISLGADARAEVRFIEFTDGDGNRFDTLRKKPAILLMICEGPEHRRMQSWGLN